MKERRYTYGEKFIKCGSERKVQSFLNVVFASKEGEKDTLDFVYTYALHARYGINDFISLLESEGAKCIEVKKK